MTSLLIRLEDRAIEAGVGKERFAGAAALMGLENSAPATSMIQRAWLFTILHNQHVNEVRRAAREGTSVAIEDAAPMLTTQSNAFDAMQLREREAAIAKLPQEQRQVILLVRLEGLPYEEVASILQVPIGTVRSRLSRGRSLLRQLMDMEENVDAALPSQESSEGDRQTEIDWVSKHVFLPEVFYWPRGRRFWPAHIGHPPAG